MGMRSSDYLDEVLTTYGIDKHISYRTRRRRRLVRRRCPMDSQDCYRRR